MKKILAALAFGVAVLPMLSGSAFAHGCHRDVERDRFGWHRHGHECRRIEVEREHRSYRYVPRCEVKCHYIGPFKECKRVCD